MNIAYNTNAFSYEGGGLVTAVSGLARAVAAGVDRLTVSAYASSAPGADDAHWRGLETRAIAGHRIAGVHWASNLDVILNELSPDLVHSHGLWLRSSAQSHSWAKKNRKPYLVSPHGMLDPWALRNSAWKKRLTAAWFERAHLEGAACLHALCQSEADSIRAYGLTNPICVIPNGVELPECSRLSMSGVALAKTGPLRRSDATVPDAEHGNRVPWLHLESDEDSRHILLFLGRIHAKKGIRELLEAWSKLSNEAASMTESWRIVIAGWAEDDHEEALKRQCRDSGIDSEVTFVGPVFGAEKEALLRASSAFILPSFSEGLPMSILEAWSYRLPVVMTEACNLPSGFAHGAALDCRPDAGSIADALKRLFKMDDSARAEIGANGYSLVERDFSWASIADKMIAVYRWILEGGDRPDCVV